jgi:hypothetical protein
MTTKRKLKSFSLHNFNSDSMPSQPTPKVIYLDQKCWIDIAKIYYDESSYSERELVKKFFDASETGQVIFPLSIAHLDETIRIADDERRNRLAHLMAKMSNAYSFQPYIEPLIRKELLNIFRRKLGLKTANIRDFVLKKGVSHLLGAKPTLVPKKGANEPPEELKKKVFSFTEGPEGMEFVLRQRILREDMDRKRRALIAEVEKMRADLLAIKDKNLRQRTYLARSVVDLLVPELTKITIENNLPRDLILHEKMTRKDIDDFLNNIPTALSLFTLIYHRNQQIQRPIPANDSNDIWFLSLAIPYSDIVVTEKMWASIAKRTKLDRRCKTIVLRSIMELAELI